MTPTTIWSDRFHWCALAAGFMAFLEGRLDDSCYVRDPTYRMYEDGAFADRAIAHRQSTCQKKSNPPEHSVAQEK
jgi:hypothetical protein